MRLFRKGSPPFFGTFRAREVHVLLQLRLLLLLLLLFLLLMQLQQRLQLMLLGATPLRSTKLRARSCWG